ncbi:MAG TPA: ATP-binding cassette domain-containing protein [Bacillota bacterium]|nr:ATP-binding cassette domain-containing protein [Bacillota bacterium]
MSSDAIIEVKNFSMNLGSFRLQNINLDIRRNEVFAILGKTGSGKTALLESVAGFYKGKAGEIRIEGKNVTETPLEQRQIGFVYQDFGLFPHMTAFENISYGLKMQKVNRLERREIVQKTAGLLSISHILEQFPGTLSGGERQRTALARALVLRPKVLLMDEPFSSLDPITKQAMYEQIKGIHEIYGCTILFVTHDFTEAQTMADRIGIMSNGQLKAVRDKTDLFKKSDDVELNKFLGLTKGDDFNDIFFE